jgi:hypothetical protein
MPIEYASLKPENFAGAKDMDTAIFAVRLLAAHHHYRFIVHHLAAELQIVILTESLLFSLSLLCVCVCVPVYVQANQRKGHRRRSRNSIPNTPPPTSSEGTPATTNPMLARVSLLPDAT